MTRNTLGRRAVSVILVVLALLAVPAVANARFSASRTSGLAASTDRMETPSGLTGSYRCSRSGNTEYMSVTVTTFIDPGPSTTWGFSLGLGATVKDSAVSATKTVTLDSSRTNDGQSTTWTVGVQGFLARWSGGIGSVNIVCPPNANKNSTF